MTNDAPTHRITADPTYRINDDMVTRWAFLVAKTNGLTLFEVHRPGCRDLLKVSYPLKKYAFTHNGDTNTAPVDGPDEAAVARIIAAQFYGNDETAVDASDVRRMPCMSR